MSERTARRKYRESELPLWFRRISKGWESHFRREELEYGRALYKSGCIREIELNSSEAFITARLEDASEPFCIIDFDGDDFVYIPTTSDDFLYGALKVAGFYEIEEFVIDRVAELGVKFDELKEAESPRNGGIAEEREAEGETCGAAQEPEPEEEGGAEEGEEDSAESGRRLALNFSSRRKGLVFEVFWKLGGRRKKAFGGRSVPVDELSEAESGLLMRLITMARKAGFKFEDNVFVMSEISKISAFLKNTLASWKSLFSIRKDRQVELLALGERKIMLSARAKSLDSSSGDFDIEWLPTVGGKAISRDDISKIFNGKSSVQILPEYGILSISNKDSDFVKNVERARGYGFAEGKIPKYMLLALAEFGENMALSDDLKNWVETLSSQSGAPDFAAMPFLRNYQKKAVAWVVNLFRHGCNAMIADEMGLGKTVQTLGVFKVLSPANSGERKMFLVVCPASVIPVWEAEAKKFFPEFKTQILSSKTRRVSGDILIASYTQMRRNKDFIDAQNFEAAVLDEAQFIKNPDSKTTAACASIKAKYKLALTGTPVENRLLDLWTSFRWLMPGLMGSRRRFEEIVQNSGGAIELVRRQISPFVLRRLKSEVARELPEKIFIDLLCPMSDLQKSEYASLIEKTKSELESTPDDETSRRWTVLSLLTRLRQTCCDARLLPWVDKSAAELGGKISVLADRVQELILGGKKVLVFSQFTKFLELIGDALKTCAAAAEIFELTGATRDRAKPVEMFQNAKGGAVMLVSLRAGGTGITLTSADYVFLADPWWNPAVEEQAIDRVHRIGRRGDVFVYRLVSQGTVEDRVRSLQAQKKGIFNRLLGDLKDVSNKGKFIETIKDIIG